MTNYLLKLYEERGVILKSRKDKEDIQEIKEKFGEVRMENNDQTSSSNVSVDTRFTSMNKKEYMIGREKYECAEVLFKPAICGKKDGNFYYLLDF